MGDMTPKSKSRLHPAWYIVDIYIITTLEM